MLGTKNSILDVREHHTRVMFVKISSLFDVHENQIEWYLAFFGIDRDFARAASERLLPGVAPS